MPRIQPIDRHPTGDAERESIALVEEKKIRPNNFLRTLGHSPAALRAYLAMNAEVAKVGLGTRVRELVSLAQSQRHACRYCLSAHEHAAGRAGIDEEARALARAGHAKDAREDAIVTFALALIESRGRVATETLDAARAAGLGDADLVEIAAVVAVMTFSNYVNLMADTDVDFPLAPNLP